MNVKLSGGLGYIQAVLEELVDGDQSLLVKIIRGLAAEDLLNEHLAQRDRKLIDQTANSKRAVSNNILLRGENLAYIKSHSGFLVGTGNFLQLAYDSSVCNMCSILFLKS